MFGRGTRHLKVLLGYGRGRRGGVVWNVAWRAGIAQHPPRSWSRPEINRRQSADVMGLGGASFCGPGISPLG